MKKATKKAVSAIILGSMSLVTGLLGYGGYTFGIPALILGILAAREKGEARTIGLMAIIFACIGIAESTTVLIMVRSLKAESMKKIIDGTAGTEVAVKNWGIIVTPPIYTKTFYEEFLEDTYYIYESKKGYRFALVKIKAINHGKEEDNTNLHAIKLVTTEGIKYKKKPWYLFHRSAKSLKSPPNPLIKRFMTSSVFPRESKEGYFYFQIPVDAVPETLFFKHDYVPVTEVRINLQPKRE